MVLPRSLIIVAEFINVPAFGRLHVGRLICPAIGVGGTGSVIWRRPRWERRIILETFRIDSPQLSIDNLLL
jgi:hypothetical protein